MANDVRHAETPKWDAVVLICKECRRRKNGPDILKTKALVRSARGQLKQIRPRPRVLSTGCLGVCPNDAIAVACVGRGVPSRVISVGTLDEFDEAMLRLFDRDPGPGRLP